MIVIPGRGQTVDFAIELIDRLELTGFGCAVLGADRNSWYQGRFMEPIPSNQPDLDHSLERIDELVAAARGRHISPASIALVGYSQGACVVSEYLYRRQTRWGAGVIFTGGLFGPAAQRWACDGVRLAGTPILLTNSDCDPWVPLHRTQETTEVLRRCGAEGVERVYEGRPHEVSAEEVVMARELLFRLKKPRTLAAQREGLQI